MPWVEQELRKFFPFRQLFLAHGELVAGEIRITHSAETGHDSVYLLQLSTTFELRLRSSLVWWIEHRQPFYIDPACPAHHTNLFEVDEINRFGLGNIAAHGVVNVKSNAGTYFAFAGIPDPLTTQHLDALRLIAPVLNDLFLTLVTAPRSPPSLTDVLTVKQVAIVRLVLAYLDDKSIARTLDISEKTVRNQLTNIYAKFGISRRAELMALLL